MEIQRVQQGRYERRRFYSASLINIPRVTARHAVSTIFVRLRKPTVYSLVTILLHDKLHRPGWKKGKKKKEKKIHFHRTVKERVIDMKQRIIQMK